MSPKIGVFCPTLNVYGGGEFVAIAIANTLAQQNHDVVLFSADKINPEAIKNYFGETLHPKIQTIQQPTHFTSRGLGDFYQTLIHSYIARNKCQTLIDAFSNCVLPWTQITYIHFPYLNRFAFKENFPYLNRPRFNQAGALPEVILEKKLVNYDKRLVLANSHYTAAEIERYSHKTAQVLYPPFPSTITQTTKDIAKKVDENLVITVSRLDANKLLERIPTIAAQTDKDIRFAVIGRLCSQPTLNQLEALVKRHGLTHRVKFYPNASAQKKADLLSRAKIYLHTMEGEHFGISIVEAMAYGCIPIVHNSGGMREFVPQNYRYQTPLEAAEKISQEITHWTAAKADGAKAIANQFSLSQFSEKFMELFNKFFT
ncbi:MAG TPA: glycosyltransferase [Candidatus Acidoferrales bacterium]|nr:glycosyltransferase [Candidatus Acidoferrales bacterium]